MAPARVDRFLYVAVVAVLAVMPGTMSLLPPAIKHFMGTQDIGLKFGLVLTGEVIGLVCSVTRGSVTTDQIQRCIED